ncbi:hypothetical protein WDU94_007110 [Cyamophila willieti]
MGEKRNGELKNDCSYNWLLRIAKKEKGIEAAGLAQADVDSCKYCLYRKRREASVYIKTYDKVELQDSPSELNTESLTTQSLEESSQKENRTQRYEESTEKNNTQQESTTSLEIKKEHLKMKQDDNATRHDETTEETKMQREDESTQTTQTHEETSEKIKLQHEHESTTIKKKKNRMKKRVKTTTEVDITNYTLLKQQMDDYWRKKKDEQVKIRFQPPMEAMSNVVAMENYIVDQLVQNQKSSERQ